MKTNQSKSINFKCAFHQPNDTQDTPKTKSICGNSGGYSGYMGPASLSWNHMITNIVTNFSKNPMKSIQIRELRHTKTILRVFVGQLGSNLAGYQIWPRYELLLSLSVKLTFFGISRVISRRAKSHVGQSPSNAKLWDKWHVNQWKRCFTGWMPLTSTNQLTSEHRTTQYSKEKLTKGDLTQSQQLLNDEILREWPNITYLTSMTW